VALSSDRFHAQRLAVPLASMQVDVTTRLGALSPATTTGLPALDRLLCGGLRTGTLLSIAGAGGSGKTALALLMAYMAARTRAAVVYVSAVLDETEVVARLAARAMYREYPEAEISYSSIWSGEAWRDDFTRQAVGTSVNVAVRKVGNLLHLLRARALQSTAEVITAASCLWSRHERVVIVIDGLEAFAASAGGDAARAAAVNADFANRLSQIAHEFKQMADSGCAVVVTALPTIHPFILPVCTLACELGPTMPPPESISARERALGACRVTLSITKNRIGPLASIPLRFIAGASVFEQENEEAEH
jgi:RecA/RadA recombinase